MALKIQQNSIFQVGLIVLFWVASELVVKLAKLPVPGGVLGLGIVLSLLMTRRIRLDNIKRGTELLLGDMLLFFIPAVLAIIEHQELLSMLGLKILFIILSSTFFVMVVTAIVVDYCYQWRTKHVSLHTG